MKILVLGYRFDEVSAAGALSETARHLGAGCELLELSSLSPESPGSPYRRIISRTREIFSSKVSLTSEEYSKALFDYIVSGGYYSVVCTDLDSISAVTAMKKRHRFSVPCYGLLTDYASVMMLSSMSLDGYFIPHEDLKPELVSKGVKEDRLYPTGVPVGQQFSFRRTKAAARNYLVIPDDRKVYLFMTGGVSFENIRSLLDELLRSEDDDFVAFVLVSRGGDMKERLEQRYRENDRIRVITFTKKVSVYLECADVVLAEPGGFESTEAAVAGVPLVHIMTVRERERHTADFFSSREMSLKGNSVSDAIEKAKRLVNEKAVAARMIQRQYMNTKSDAAENIIKTLLRKKEG